MENCDKCGTLTHESSLGSPEHIDMFLCPSCMNEPMECSICGEEFNVDDLWNVSLDCDDPALVCEGCHNDMCKTNKCVIKGEAKCDYCGEIPEDGVITKCQRGPEGEVSLCDKCRLGECSSCHKKVDYIDSTHTESEDGDDITTCDECLKE